MIQLLYINVYRRENPMELNMDLEVLEYKKVIELIKPFCFSDYGKEYLEKLLPTYKPEQELSKVQELIEALQYDGEPPLGGIVYLKEQFEKVFQGFLLSPIEILKIRDFFLAIHALKKFYEKLSNKYPKIWSILSDVEEANHFCKKVTSCINEDGIIKNSASPRLKEIRNEIEKTISSLKNLAERLSRKYRDSLQEPPFIQRDGRYIFLVKSSRRKEVKGMLVSSSSSGMTLYIEPEEIIDLNNKLRQLEIDEKEEERRIIREVLQLLVEKEKKIIYTIESISYFDSLYARARYGIKKRAVIPEINSEGIIKFVNARHPLIDEKKVVPISIELEKNKYGIIITGPNTGGKTVALKTVGLLTLMFMAGIPVPCDPGSVLSIFENVKADIGDEQSIEQSLSTFSSHMLKIIEMLKIANDKTLILIDEIGAGTDPVEGAALAIAIINYFLNKKSRIIVTTHLTPLKLYAFEDTRLVNAAVEFDIETLKPTYRIMMGVAGSSQAIEIAKRLGIPQEILRASKKYMDNKLKNIDSIIHELQTEKIKLERKKQEIESLKEELEIKNENLNKQIEKLKRNKTHELLKEIDELASKIQMVKKFLENSVSKARKTQNLQELEKLNREIQKISPRFVDNLRDKLLGRTDEELKNFKTGDFVRIINTTSTGKIIELEDKKAIVDINGIKFETTIDKLEKVNGEIPEFDKTKIGITRAKEKLEIDIRGMSTDEIEDIIERFIDNLVLNNINVGYIIHGKGTLRLAKRVREILVNDPRVRSFKFAPPEAGGTGATIVEVK